MSISANFPNVRPSLLLDFAQSQQLDPRVTFSRSTTAPYYDGKTSVLAEQNLLLQSQTFGSWSYVVSSTVTANSTTAPDNTSTGSLLTFNTTGISGYVAQDLTLVTGNIYAYSVYAKVGNSSKFQLQSNNGAIRGTFDLVALTYTNISGTPLSSGLISVGNGWYRCYFTFAATLSTTVPSYIRGDTGTAIGDNIYVWGAQLEQRSSVTAYNATTTTALTNYIPQLLTAPINAPRFDFNPTTGESLGMLIEQSSTNLLLYSEQFDNAAWTKSNSTITANTIVAPDGTLTGDKLVENTTASVAHNVGFFGSSVTLGTSYSLSIYAKAGERSRFWLRGTGTGNVASAYFDLSAGTVLSGTGTITPVGNGWYKCSASGVSDVTGATAWNSLIYLVDTGTNYVYTGNGYSGIYIWGAQLEALAFPTSYIPTTSAQVTRASDNASMTGTNFSSWYNNAQGTFYSEFARINAGTLGYPALFTTDSILVFADTVNENMKNIYANNQLSIVSSGTGQKKVSFVYSQAVGYGFIINGTGFINNTSQVNSATFINFNPAGNPTSIRIKKFAYYPQALTSAQLQALTGS